MRDQGWLRQQIGGRLWIWPAIAAVMAVTAAELLVRLDRRLFQVPSAWVFGGDATAARSVLSTIATATMTVLGVVLTITLTVLTLAANTYSPRILRTISRDGVVKAVMSGFVATFAFALDALRLVRSGQVPSLTVTVSVVFAFASLGLLIALFHHLAVRIRVESVIAEVHRETRQAIERQPRLGDTRQVDQALPAATEHIRATRTGRLVRVDEARMLHRARSLMTTVVLAPRVGDMIIEGDPLLSLHGGRPPGPDDREDLCRAVEVSVDRTLEQDFTYGVRQLVDIALRALSPGIQDPTTAHEALYRCMDLLSVAADRDLGVRVLWDDERPVFVRRAPDWPDLLDLVCTQARGTAEAQRDMVTLATMVTGLGRVIRAAGERDRLLDVRREVREILDAAARAAVSPGDRARVEAAAGAAMDPQEAPSRLAAGSG
ncbi:MAG: DUF2254 domain-containing protein [Thermoleophilia bacterium]